MNFHNLFRNSFFSHEKVAKNPGNQDEFLILDTSRLE